MNDYWLTTNVHFQVFVANPNKPKPILDILLRNQDKLVDFLTKFHTDRSEDEQFNDEKAYLIKQIKELKPAKEWGVKEKMWMTPPSEELKWAR